MQQSDLGDPKVDILERYATPTLAIEGVDCRFDENAAARMGVAPRVLVGADDIPTRWAVQRLEPNWLGIGATGHLFAIVSSHGPDGPCAGCVHPEDDPLRNERIPTLSVVSFFAGLLAACELLSVAHRVPRSGVVTECFPAGMVDARNLRSRRARPHRSCPVGCRASRSA